MLRPGCRRSLQARAHRCAARLVQQAYWRGRHRMPIKSTVARPRKNRLALRGEGDVPPSAFSSTMDQISRPVQPERKGHRGRPYWGIT